MERFNVKLLEGKWKLFKVAKYLDANNYYSGIEGLINWPNY